MNMMMKVVAVRTRTVIIIKQQRYTNVIKTRIEVKERTKWEQESHAFLDETRD